MACEFIFKMHFQFTQLNLYNSVGVPSPPYSFGKHPIQKSLLYSPGQPARTYHDRRRHCATAATEKKKDVNGFFFFLLHKRLQCFPVVPADHSRSHVA